MRERVTVVTEKKKPLFFYLESRTREHWKVNISRRKRWAFRQRFFPAHQLQKHLKGNKRKNLHFVRKYAHVSVLGHYLFLEAYIFFELRSRKTIWHK